MIGTIRSAEVPRGTGIRGAIGAGIDPRGKTKAGDAATPAIRTVIGTGRMTESVNAGNSVRGSARRNANANGKRNVKERKRDSGSETVITTGRRADIGPTASDF